MTRTITSNFTLKEPGKLEKARPLFIRRLTKQAESLNHEGRPPLAWSLCACATGQTSKA